MTQAIQDYHDLLTPEVAADSHAMLEDQLKRRGLIFGDRPLCTVLRPRLMTRGQHELMHRRVRVLMRAFGKAYQAAMADPGFREQFRLERWEEQLIGHDHRFRDASPTSRLDAFVMDEAGTMALTEYNAETPAGAGFNDQLAGAFASLPIMRAFGRHYQIEPLLAQAGVINVLLDAYHEWAGRRTLPRVAIVDWPDVPTRLEFVLYQQYFHSLGIECVIADPREMDYLGGRLIAEGAPVDLIYKRVLITELVKQCGLDHAVVRAVRDNVVCMVNPFRSKILHKKASLAVLSDERNARLFRPDELEAIRAHVPWTRIVEDRRTVHDGEQVDMLAFIAERRDRMVLKPNDDYGGAGIVLGWEVTDNEWQAAIRSALASPYIVQERVPIPSEPFPSMVDGRVEIYDRMLDTAPFVSYGEFMQGQLTRLSTAALLNVTAGGGSTVPTFLIEKR
jgi:hypothetical protein